LGLSRLVESLTTASTSFRGTARWLAPEELDSTPGRKRDRKKRDVYAFACSVLEVHPFLQPFSIAFSLVLQIFTDKHPFHDIPEHQLFHKVLVQREQPDIPESAPPQLKQLHPLLKKCWASELFDRPSVDDILKFIIEIKTKTDEKERR
jgi:serine/threonine protein kinase